MELPAEFFQSTNSMRTAMSFLMAGQPSHDFFVIATDEKANAPIQEGTDVGVGVALSPANARLGSCTAPIHYVFITFVTAPPIRSNAPSPFFSAFRAPTWCLIFLAAGSFTIAITALMRLGAELHFHQFRLSSYSTILATFSFTMKSYMRQSDPKFEKKISKTTGTMKALLIFWLFYVMIVGFMYESKLLSTLVSPAVEKVPATFEELIGFNYTIIYFTTKDAAYQTMKNSSNQVYRDLVRVSQLTRDPRRCMKATLQKPKTACLIYDTFAKLVMDTGSYRKYRMATAQTFFVGATWLLHKDFLFTQNFNVVIQRVAFMGLVDKWYRNYNAEVRRERILSKEEDTVTTEDKEYELCMKSETCTSKLKYLIFVFYPLLTAMLLAIVTSVIEYMWWLLGSVGLFC